MTELTQASLRQAVHYSPDTGCFSRLTRTSNRINVGDPAGYLGAGGYVRFFVGGKLYPAHRLAWFYMTGEWPDEIDHINGDRADNRLANLRNVNRRMNMQNLRRACARNKLGVLGVSVQKGRFRAQIVGPAGKIHLGLFGSKAEAHAAYLRAKREMHEGCTL